RHAALRFRTHSEYPGAVTFAIDRPAPTQRSSDLSKHSAEVFAEAEDHPVTVTRRDGEALVLVSPRDADRRARLRNLAAQQLRGTLDDDATLAERMSRS